MATDQERADQMQRMTVTLLEAIRASGPFDSLVVLGAVGALQGALAKASGNPQATLDAMVAVAQRVIGGDEVR